LRNPRSSSSAGAAASSWPAGLSLLLRGQKAAAVMIRPAADGAADLEEIAPFQTALPEGIER